MCVHLYFLKLSKEVLSYFFPLLKIRLINLVPYCKFSCPKLTSQNKLYTFIFNNESKNERKTQLPGTVKTNLKGHKKLLIIIYHKTLFVYSSKQLRATSKIYHYTVQLLAVIHLFMTIGTTWLF